MRSRAASPLRGTEAAAAVFSLPRKGEGSEDQSGPAQEELEGKVAA